MAQLVPQIPGAAQALPRNVLPSLPSVPPKGGQAMQTLPPSPTSTAWTVFCETPDTRS
jgi:hypothetical protein